MNKKLPTSMARINREVLTLLLLLVCSPMNAQDVVTEVVVYKVFWRGGTTLMVTNLFEKPENHTIDTTNINTCGTNFTDEFQVILNSKPKRHYPQKIIGIKIAGEIWRNHSEKLFFIFCIPNRIIDLTNKKEYKVKDKALLKDMYDWIDPMKSTEGNIDSPIME